MKFIHLSDLHLDSPFVGMSRLSTILQKRLIDAPYQAFRKAIELAITESVDFVIITGDLFNQHKQTIFAQHFFMEEMLRLKQHGIEVVMIHGNHDYLNENKANLNYPANVHLLAEAEVESYDLDLANGESVRFYGFSYRTRWIRDNMLEQFPVNDHSTSYIIGLLHAAPYTNEATADLYAPFHLQDLLSKNYDYWALGHIHQAYLLNESPLVQYAGTIQGRQINESGDKGCYLIAMDSQHNLSNQFISLAQIVWQEVSIYCQPDWQASELVSHIQEILTNFEHESKYRKQSFILQINLNNTQKLEPDLLEQIQAGELQALFPYNIKDEEFVIISRFKLDFHSDINVFNYDESLRESYQAIVANLTTESVQDTMLDELKAHPLISKYFNLTREAALTQEMIEAAQGLITQMVGLELNDEDDRHAD